MDMIIKDGEFDMVYHLAANSDIQKGGKDPMVDYMLTFNTTFNVFCLNSNSQQLPSNFSAIF